MSNFSRIWYSEEDWKQVYELVNQIPTTHRTKWQFSHKGNGSLVKFSVITGKVLKRIKGNKYSDSPSYWIGYIEEMLK